jgi:hypothetical protein
MAVCPFVDIASVRSTPEDGKAMFARIVAISTELSNDCSRMSVEDEHDLNSESRALRGSA